MTTLTGWTNAMLRSRIDALARFDRIWIDSLQREIDSLKLQLAAAQRTLIRGGDITILGYPAHLDVTITWPEGAPHGLTIEQLAEVAGRGVP